MEDSREHNAGEGEVVESFEGGVESFVIAGKAPEACCPCETAFDDPTAGQQDEAAFGHGVLDHLEPDAVLLGRLDCGLAGIALRSEEHTSELQSLRHLVCR